MSEEIKGIPERDIFLNEVRDLKDKLIEEQRRRWRLEEHYEKELKVLEKKKNKRITFLKQMVKRLNKELRDERTTIR